jgi:UPF0271 protein
MRIDLNADVGESFGAYTIGDDVGLMASITSANIAAGFHGGDPSVLRATIRLAKSHGVAVGAHPGFPDLVGFGRRELDVSAESAEDFILYQIAAVAGVAAAEGVPLRHVKAHGALYNRAATDPGLAAALARAVAAFDASLTVFVPPHSQMAATAHALGLRVAIECFADRGYLADGRLVPRQAAGAVMTDPEVVVPRAVRLIREGVVVAVDGEELRLEADTLCVHGDTPGAAALAAAVRSGLEAAGIDVRSYAAL